MTGRAIAISCSIACALCVRAARADDVNGAANAFSQAQQAMLAGDPARAADLYELADELAPSAPALRNATRARLAANHEAMAATLAAELLRRYPNDKESREVAETVLSKLAPHLSQFQVTCSEDCTITLDGKAASSKARASHQFFAQPGARTVGATFDGGRQATKQVTALVGQTSTLRLDAPPRPAQPAAPIAAAPAVPTDRPVAVEHSHGTARTWFIVTAVATIGFGVATAVEGTATLDTRDQIKAAVAAGDQTHAMALYDDGRDQQLRTNILLGATAVAGVATIVLAFTTDWSGGAERRGIAVAPSRDGAAVIYSARF